MKINKLLTLSIILALPYSAEAAVASMSSDIFSGNNNALVQKMYNPEIANNKPLDICNDCNNNDSMQTPGIFANKILDPNNITPSEQVANSNTNNNVLDNQNTEIKSITQPEEVKTTLEDSNNKPKQDDQIQDSKLEK